MKLIPNAKRVLTRAYAMWAFYVAMIFSVLDAVQPGVAALLPTVADLIPQSTYRTIAFISGILVPVLRVIDQGIATGKQAAKDAQ